MLIRQQLSDLRKVQNGGHELARNIAIEEPVSVLAEYGCIPHRIVRPEADEPSEQQIVIKLLHQLSFGPYRIEGLQQQRAQQTLRRNRGPAVPGIPTPTV